jgi:hypothetical protein
MGGKVYSIHIAIAQLQLRQIEHWHSRFHPRKLPKTEITLIAPQREAST